MATTTTDHTIRTRIDTFLSELSGLVRKAALDSVHEVLSGSSSSRRRRGPGRPKGSSRSPGRPRKKARRGRPARAAKRIRRSAADLEKIAARVLAHVKSNAGHRLEQIGKALQVETAILKRPIANLLAARKLKTRGQKRGTMYFAGGRGGKAKKAGRKAKARVRRPAKRTRRAAKRARRASPRVRKASKRARRAPRKRPSKPKLAIARDSVATAAMEAAVRRAAG
jgi:hypothetical protein